MKVTCFSVCVSYAAGSQRTQRHRLRLRLSALNYFDFPCVFVACGACRLPAVCQHWLGAHTREQMIGVSLSFLAPRLGSAAEWEKKLSQRAFERLTACRLMLLIFGVSLKVGNSSSLATWNIYFNWQQTNLNCRAKLSYTRLHNVINFCIWKILY